MDKQKIGDFIRVKRKEKGLTQVELSEKLGVSDRAVSKWERGICCPDISLLKDLCKILDININELLSGNELKEITKEQSEDILVETVKTYTNVEKKKNRTLLIFTIIILIFYTFLVFAMYLTFNQTNKRGGMNWETIQTKKVAERIFYALENYDYDEIRRIENKYTDIIANGGNAQVIDDETKCMDYLEKDKNTSWALACRLKDFENKGIRFKSHKFENQYYNSLGSYTVSYKVIISYKNIDNQMIVFLGTHNGVLNNISSSGPGPIENDEASLNELGYEKIFNKIIYFFNFIPEDHYIETVDVNHNN